MKKSNACQYFARLFHGNTNCAKTLCQMAVVAALALVLPNLAQAQPVNQLYFPFANATGTTTPSSTALGGLSGINLTMYNKSSAAANLHGALGTGLDGGRALDLTIGDTANAGGSANGSGAADAALDVSDANIAFAGGNTVSSFVLSMWINEGGALTATTGTFPRLFILDATAGTDVDGGANAIGVKFQQGNQLYIAINDSGTGGLSSSASSYVAGVGGTLQTTFTPFPSNTWIFLAWVYDGTTIYSYLGSNGVPATLQSSEPAAGLSVNLGGTPSLYVGNKGIGGTRGFYGQIQDVCFYTGVPTNPLPFLQGAQASNQLTLNVNFIDDSVGIDYCGGTEGTAMTGPAVIGFPGDYWNALGGFAYSSYPNGPSFYKTNLLYQDSSRSTVAVTLAPPGNTFDANACGGTTPYDGGPYQDLMQTFISDSTMGTPGYVNLSGLSPGATYNLYVYSAGNAAAAGRVSYFSVGGGGGTATTTWNGTDTGFTSGVDYLEFSGVTADVNGNLSIDFGGNTNTENDFNGFQLQFISGTPPVILPTLPTVVLTTSNLAGNTLCTNTSVVFTANSPVSTISSFTVSVTTNVLYPSSPGTTLAWPGVISNNIGTATATVTIPLTAGFKYSITVTCMDANSQVASATAVFDTIVPVLVIEATDYNYNGGSFMDAAAYGTLPAAYGGVWQYYTASNSGTINGLEGYDFFKSGAEGPGALFYRDLTDGITAPNAAPYITENNADTVSEQKYAVATTGTTNGVNAFPELGIGYDTDNPGDWQMYTRTFGAGGSAPATNYNIWLFMASSGTGEQARLYSVTPSPYNSGSTLSSNQIGQFGTASFSENDWNGFEYVPLTDANGGVKSVSIGAGVDTFQLRVGTGQGPNLGFLMLLPAASVGPPVLSSIYPDGTHPFEQTNSISFIANPGLGAAFPSSADVHLVLNGVDVSSGLTYTAVGTSWKASYPINYNTVYSAVINLTNNLNLVASLPISFDTLNSNYYTWMAVDYDFSTNNDTGSPPAQGGESGPGWISAQFIDNPIPTGDINGVGAGPVGTEATNSYFGYPEDFTGANAPPPTDPYGAGAIAQQGVDINFTAAAGGLPYEQYRWVDGVGGQPMTDYLLPKFVTSQNTGWPVPLLPPDPNVGMFNICYVDAGDWLNYTRHYPPGDYYVWGRLAYDANYSTTLSQVTSGVGTTNQTVSVLGTFVDNNAQGFQAWHWILLTNSLGNPVVLNTTGAATTLRATMLTGQNVGYFLLAPGPLMLTPWTAAGQYYVSFPVQPGSTYLFLYKSNLSAPSWTTLYTITLNNAGVVTSITPSSPSVTASGGVVTVNYSTPGYYTAALVP